MNSELGEQSNLLPIAGEFRGEKGELSLFMNIVCVFT